MPDKPQAENSLSATPLDKTRGGKALYVQLIGELRKHILDGNLPPGARLPTINELSEQYGISPGTVRQATNVLIEEGLVERIQGSGTYVRDWQAESKKEETATKRIGMVIVNLSGELSMKIMDGVEQAAKARGYQLSMTSTSEPHRQQAVQVNDIARLRDDQVAGMIIFPVSDVPSNPALDELKQAGIPVVLVDRYYPEQDTDYVVGDNYSGGYRATEHLIILGHQRIGFVYEYEARLTTTSVWDRWCGYKDALEEYGLDYDEALVFQKPDVSPDDARDLYRDYLLTQRPSAVFAVKDLVAVDLLQVAQRAGIRVPEDMALVGFDNLNMAAYLTPTLTTVEQLGVEMGLRAANLLIDRIEGYWAPPQHIVLPVSLIVRESCGARLHVRRRNQNPSD
ncbi:MAG: substrate-binding domain-containing protein [Chloroflexi bacterium]|nr:substrate-binding domain-containing protein [Chloroflexota bacterium]